jgi:hypothetical protein
VGLCESGRLTRQTDIHVDALCDDAEGHEGHCERQVYQAFKSPGSGSTGIAHLSFMNQVGSLKLAIMLASEWWVDAGGRDWLGLE